MPGLACRANNFSRGVDLVLKLFNLIFISRCIPSLWSLGYISPIYKSGDQMDPDNDRGICVISCLSKLFLSTLNQRLSSFVSTFKIINRSQIEVQRSKHTSDHIFSLKTIINKHVSPVPEGKFVFCDSVWQKGLLAKLEALNINGPFLDLVKSLYKNASYSVKIGNKMTKLFKCYRGVMQGCPLSPILFNLFSEWSPGHFK